MEAFLLLQCNCEEKRRSNLGYHQTNEIAASILTLRNVQGSNEFTMTVFLFQENHFLSRSEFTGLDRVNVHASCNGRSKIICSIP